MRDKNQPFVEKAGKEGDPILRRQRRRSVDGNLNRKASFFLHDGVSLFSLRIRENSQTEYDADEEEDH